MNVINEEIRVMKHMASHLRRAISLEPNQGKRDKMKRDVNELERMIESKLKETGDFVDVNIGGDKY